jgi:transglutaminase-like putative cysteine protease
MPLGGSTRELGCAPVRRVVSAELELDVHAGAELALQIAAAGAPVDEVLDIRLDGAPIEAVEVPTPHGGRAHLLDVGPGRLALRYAATLTGRAPPSRGGDDDRLVYLRPSRYAESDKLAAFAAHEFAGLADAESIVAGVSSWVGARVAYEAGTSLSTHGAIDTLLGRRGVCRDFAHLVAALLRALGVPARITAVYAPGLSPMDFHAVVEALVEGQWRVVDATLLAPRASLVRIATGRDAADTAFLTTIHGEAELLGIQVNAIVDGNLPDDDPRLLMSLG